jgi:hypothetical protein
MALNLDEAEAQRDRQRQNSLRLSRSGTFFAPAWRPKEVGTSSRVEKKSGGTAKIYDLSKPLAARYCVTNPCGHHR